jgi:excinuclease ABC subunit C
LNPALDGLKLKIAEFPTEPGIYMMRNAKGKIVYVGKAKSLRNRVRSYFGAGMESSLKTKYLMMNVIDIEYMRTKTEVEAYLLEASLIKKHRPRYNIRLKDDKAYPYIRASLEHDFPRFYLARRVAADGAMYFGPYTSGLSVRETIRFLNKTWKIRDCTDGFFKTRQRPCISHQIGQCTAPCVKFIGKEEYRVDVDSALQFLKGRDGKFMKDLNQRMKTAASEEKFEQAARLRDSIQAIERIFERQTVVNMHKDFDQDVVAFVGDERGTMIETLHIRGGRVIGSRPHFINRFNCNSPEEDPKEWLTSFLTQYYSENIIPDEIILQVDLGNDIIKLMQAVFIERQNKKAKVHAATGSEGKKLLDLTLTNAESHFKDAVTKADRQAKGLEQIQEKFGLKNRRERTTHSLCILRNFGDITPLQVISHITSDLIC